MNRFYLCGLMVLTAGCGGSRSSPPPSSTPTPAPPPQAAQEPATPSQPEAELPTPALDSFPEDSAGVDLELADELELALDSAADAALIAQLADVDSAGGDAIDEVTEAIPGHPSGGANAVSTAAVSWDIDVESFTNHRRVQYWLDFFQGPARERFGIWLSRMPRYEQMIRENLQARGLPGDMTYLALIESGFSNSAVSRSRAVGMWQFMRGTGKHYGLRIDRWVDERRDPYKATKAAARFLFDLRERFGSLYLAAAAYNAGPGGVSRGLRRLPDDDADTVMTDHTFFRLYDTKVLRQETRDYVPKLIAAALIAKEPERYGFPALPRSEPFSYDSMIVADMTGLDVIARLADTTIAAIRELNPQYLRLATPPGARVVVRLPAGKGPATAAAYAALPASRRVAYREHTVRTGETLSGIATRYRTTVTDIKAANPRIRSAKYLRVGQHLIIPTSGVPLSREALNLVEETGRTGRLPSTGTHRVRSGESLWTISRRYGVTVDQLRAWNRLTRGAKLRIGQRIRVSPRGKSLHQEVRRAETISSGPTTHKVRRGDTLSGVARRYGVSLSALREANGLEGNAILRVGSRLKIPG